MQTAVSGILGEMSGPICFVVGARPNFMKVAPVLRALERRGAEVVLVHTGQHHDAQMSDAFFEELDLRQPDHHLHWHPDPRGHHNEKSWRRRLPRALRYLYGG